MSLISCPCLVIFAAQTMSDMDSDAENTIGNEGEGYNGNSSRQGRRPNLVNPRPQQRQRVTNNASLLRPFDHSLAGRPILTRLSAISLSELMDESVEEKNLDTNFIDVQVLRVIAPNSNMGTNSAFMYGNRNRNRNSQNQVHYSRLILLRVFSNTESDRLCYLMETRNTNTCLWDRNVELRDNGVVTMGTYIRVLAPKPIKSLMSGDIPMLETQFPVIVMRTPDQIQPVPVNFEIQGNNALSFVQNGAIVSVKRTAPEETTCSGLFCDKQRIQEWMGQRGCGCYHMTHRRSNIALDHSISILASSSTIKMENYSSTQFSKLYLTSNLPPSIKIRDLRMTEEYFSLLDCIGNVIEFINNNGGFTVVGWYKRGIINDRALVGNNGNNNNSNMNNSNNEEVQVDNGEVNYHIIQMQPTDHELLNPHTALGSELQELKFDVSNFHQG